MARVIAVSHQGDTEGICHSWSKLHSFYLICFICIYQRPISILWLLLYPPSDVEPVISKPQVTNLSALTQRSYWFLPFNAFYWSPEIFFMSILFKHFICESFYWRHQYIIAMWCPHPPINQIIVPYSYCFSDLIEMPFVQVIADLCRYLMFALKSEHFSYWRRVLDHTW